MQDISQLKQGIVDYLKQSVHFSAVEILSAHPGLWREHPVSCATVAVGIESVALAPAGMGACWGSSAMITVRLDLYTPPYTGGDGPTSLYESLCDVFMLQENPWCTEKLWCETSVYDSHIGAWHTVTRTLLRMALLRQKEGIPIASFDLHPTMLNE